jgi:DNA-binding response OmpR family regulator
MTKILVVEDDRAILRGLTDSLQFHGYQVITAGDGEAAYQAYETQKPDVILLDLILPKLNGVDLCLKLRRQGVQTPIVMLTAKSQEADRIEGLDAGADDYIMKPFSVGELMARLRAVLRRVQPRAGTPDELRFSDVWVDFQRFEAKRRGKQVAMTRKEFAILRLLASREGEVVSRDELLDEVWGLDSYPISRTVDYHVASLRSKLEGNTAQPRYIKTVHGVGYKFVRERNS